MENKKGSIIKNKEINVANRLKKLRVARRNLEH
jgi:hypothetical protein